MSSSLIASADNFDCSEHLMPEATVQKIFHLRDELAKDQRFVQSIKDTHQALMEFYRTQDPDSIEKMAAATPLEDAQALTDRIVPVLKSRILSEATAKAFRHYRVKGLSRLSTVIDELHAATIDDRLRFAEGVVAKGDELFEEGLRLLDKDKTSEVMARWGVTRDELLKLVQAWELMRNTGGFEVKLLMLRYLELAEKNEIFAAMKSLKKDARDLKPMTDEEQLLAARLHHPFTDADLAQNRGPITDREFNRKLLFLGGYGKLTRVANSVRRPNITIAMLALSFVPPTLSYVITRDMDGLTNVLATLMGGVGTSPLLLNVFMPSQATPKTYWWVYALNLSQLVRLDEFIAKNTVSSEAIHLHLAHPAIQERIRQLRSLRYAANGVTGKR